jgi:hypothetical protein
MFIISLPSALELEEPYFTQSSVQNRETYITQD